MRFFLLNLYKRWKLNLVLVPFFLLTFVILIYQRMLQHALVGADEVYELTLIQGQNPFIGFFAAIPNFPFVFRPLFAFQAWIALNIFGFNYSGYVMLQLLVFVLAAMVLTVAWQRIVSHWAIAFLLALVFVSHPYVSDLLTWSVDTATWTMGLVGLVVLLLIRATDRVGWYVGLGVVLVILPLLRENGLAVLAAVVVYVLVAFRLGHFTRRQSIILLVECGLAVLIYFGLRRIALSSAGGLNPIRFSEDAGMFFQFVSRQEVEKFGLAQRLFFFGYNIGIHAIASFFPLFTPCGQIWTQVITQSGALLGTAAIAFGASWAYLHRRGTTYSLRDAQRQALAVGLAVGLVAALVILWESARYSIDEVLLSVGLAIQVVLSLFVLYHFVRLEKYPVYLALIAIFSAVMILFGAGTGFAYFRYRILYLSLIGWVSLVAVALRAYSVNPFRSALRIFSICLIIVLILINGIRTYTALPVPGLLASTIPSSILCRPDVPASLAVSIGQFYKVEPSIINLCREPNAPTATIATELRRVPVERQAEINRCGRTF